MRPPWRVLIVLSADFGEYVTAAVFSRGQPFHASFAVPRRLEQYVSGGGFHVYDNLDDVPRLAAAARADVVVLASGYLFAVNRLAPPDSLALLVSRLRSAGAVVATTDPWLRVWEFDPDSRFAIYSLRKGGVDPDQSRKMQLLQRYLEDLFCGTPHLFAVPVAVRDPAWMPFFNPLFVREAPPMMPALGGAEGDEWLFVLSREDHIFLAGVQGDMFYDALEERVRELVAQPDTLLTFVGPPEVGRFLGARWPGESRIRYVGNCDFGTFETMLRRAKVVAYWNILSATLLYCLYHRVPPIFFGTGHQTKVCSGLLDHAVEHVYCGHAPKMLDLGKPLGGTADEVVQRLGLPAWLDRIGAEYSRQTAPQEVIERMIVEHGR